MNLSNKIDINEMGDSILFSEHVKEFIKELKEKLGLKYTDIQKLDKLVGKDLI